MRDGVTAAPADAGTVRVAIVMPNDPEAMRIGGIAAFVRTFAKFAPADFELAFVGVTATRPLWRWQHIELGGRQLRFLPVARGVSGVRSRIPISLRFAAALARHRSRLGLRGWIISLHRPGTDLPLRGLGLPMWRVVHLGIDDLRGQGSESRWRRLTRVLRRLEGRTFRSMDRVYAVNRDVAEQYRQLFPEVADRIHFIPNWADPTVFRPMAPAEQLGLRATVARELEAPELPATDAPLLLYAGRLEGQKDPRLLARAFIEIRAAHPGALLVVAGQGSLRPQVERVLAEAGALQAARFVGTIEPQQLARMMHASDAMLITSAFETGPTVGLEALACGLPVVTTAVGEVARVVRSQRAGAVVDERTPRAVALGVEWVMEQPADQLRQRCVDAAAPYLADQVLQELYDYNRQLAARTAGSAAAPQRVAET